MRTKTKSIYLFFIVLILLIIGGTIIWLNTDSKEVSNNALEPKIIVLSKTFKTTDSLNEMVQESDVVVVGVYKGLDSKWNMADGPIEDSQNEYVEGHLFKFHVIKTLKGNQVGEDILINHRYSEMITLEESDEVVDDTGVIVEEARTIVKKEVENKDPLYINPTNGETYMIFLKRNENLNHYFPSIEPFIIQFDSNNVAHLKSNLINLDKSKLEFETKLEKRTYYVVNEIHSTIEDNISGKNLTEIEGIIKNILE